MRYKKILSSKTFLLAAVIASIGGCDSATAPLQSPVSTQQRAWSVTNGGVTVHDRTEPGKTAKVVLPDWQWAGEPYGCQPDLALGPKGEAVITSDVLPTLWRVDPDTLAVSVHPLVLDADTDRDVGFTSIVYSPEQGAYFAVSGMHGTLWRIDAQLSRAQKVALSEPLPKACGIALQPRSTRKKAIRVAGLCVRGPQESWAVEFAPDQRSAYLRSESCGAL